MRFFSTLSNEVRQYLIITGNYWAFTLTDGALRMLVVLHFHELGYSPLEIAMLFLFYEFFGVVTNLIGGWLGAVMGLNRIMNIGLALQIVALCMLLAPPNMLSIVWVMAAQAVSGIAKDLNKMSAKSAIKLLVPTGAETTLYKWVSFLTGSKNTLKGVGFFLGGTLLTLYGFHNAVLAMVCFLVAIWAISLLLLKKDLGKAKNKPKFRHLFSKSPVINCLSAARLFLFAARDVWFVVALPVYLATTFGWDYWYVGGFLALWVMVYGCIQSIAPQLTAKTQGKTRNDKGLFKWALVLSLTPALIATASHFNLQAHYALFIGLMLFAVLFAINSSLHSYLIVSYANKDGVSMDVGFYYMANAAGRLLGTVLSGWVFQLYGFETTLLISTLFTIIAAFISATLPHYESPHKKPTQ